MIDKLKDKLSGFLLKKKVQEADHPEQNFKNFFQKSFSFFVIMPENEHNFTQSFLILKFLAEEKKHATVFTHDFRINLIPSKYRPHFIDYNLSDVSKLNMPGNRLIEKLKANKYNVLLDLNRDDNIFLSYISSIVISPIKVGFQKKDADMFYNVQVITRTEDGEISYKNFLNCLQKF